MTNSQITDSVRLAQLFNINGAPGQTMAMLNAVMSESLGIGMHNAISTQQGSQMLSAAAVTSTCARLLAVQPIAAPPPPPPPPPTPPAPPTQYTLTVIGGTGGGTYLAGTNVPITATPPSGQVFQNWSGAVVADASLANTTLAMPAGNTTITATWVPQYTLTVTNGTASDGTVTGSFAAGEKVALIATPPTGQVFQSWSAPAGVTIDQPNSPTATLTMPGVNTALTAVCVQGYTLTVTNGAVGSTSTGPSAGNFAQNANVTITAGPAPMSGQVFKSWSAPAGVIIPNTATASFPMPAAATTVTAIYG